MMNRINALWNLAVAVALVATGNGFAAHHGASVSIEDFQRAKVAIGKRVESGHITKEHAKTRLIEMRRMISNGKSEGDAS